MNAGDVVRIAPNELSFATAKSLRDIYSHPTRDRKTFVKSWWYFRKDIVPAIVSERDPQKHQEIRKSLNPAFSTRALKLQQDIILKYVDLFICQLRNKGSDKRGVPMDKWFNWLTFDIIGDLAFGKSFDAVANG